MLPPEEFELTLKPGFRASAGCNPSREKIIATALVTEGLPRRVLLFLPSLGIENRLQRKGESLRRIVALTALLTAGALAWSGGFSPSVRAQQKTATDSTTSAPRAIVIASGAQLADIRGIAVDPAGNLFISAEISPAPTGCIARSVAAHVSVAIFSNCTGARGEDPSGIAAMSDGSRIFLANQTQNSIRLLDMITGSVAIEPGASLRLKQSANASAASASQFTLSSPAGLATDSAGNLYVADRGNNRVLRLTAGGADFSPFAQVLDAAAAATDPTGREVFVASPASNRIFKIDSSTGDISVFAGTGTQPDSQAGSSAQFPAPTTATLTAIAAPEGIAVDAGENVFIADTGANSILRADAKTNLISRVALGSELSSPGALAIDRRGNLFVADRGNHRVVEFSSVAQPAVSGSITLTPGSNDFGDQPTGGTTQQQTFTLTNGTSSALTLSTADFSFSGNNPSDFEQTNNCVPQVAAGASCQIMVSFVPQGTGSRAASLMVMNSSVSQNASLTGTGDTFALTAANQNATVQTVLPGSPGNYSLSVTPDSVFNGTVTLTCPTRLPDQTMTCSINPAQPTITAGQPTAFAVTITTLSGKAPGAMLVPNVPPSGLLFGGAALLACFLALALVLSRKEKAFEIILGSSTKRRRAWAVSALAIMCAAGAAGCYHAPKTYNPVTPPGAYSIDILGTAQNASRAITLTLNVE